MALGWQVFCQDTIEDRGGRLLRHRRRQTQTYLDWMMSAWGWTVLVAGLALVVALVVGSLMGMIRTMPNSPGSCASATPGSSCSATSRCWCRSSSGTT